MAAAHEGLIKTPGNDPTKRNIFFQPKLSINTPGDTYEQEADTMANKVMRMKDSFTLSPLNNVFFKPTLTIQRKTHGSDELEDEYLHRKEMPNIQRKCATCEEEGKHLHRKENSNTVTEPGTDLSSYVSSLSASGQSLSESSRQFFEPRFGQDFSNVKIHTDSSAVQSAQSINALAYTTGNNIVFNQDQFSPNTESGQRLIAHELTHVVQQGRGMNKVQKENIIQRQVWVGPAASAACATLSDEGIYELFRDHYFSDQPNAKAHLVHYRLNGGAAYPENVKALFDANPRIRTRISMLIITQGGVAKGTTSGVFIGRGADDGKEPPIRQSDYDSEDWRNSNGNIDEVRWKLVGTFNPKGDNTYEITIVDPYTWHAGEDRPTQCIHAAMERLKSSGARDYITKGTANIVLPLPSAAPAPGKDNSI